MTVSSCNNIVSYKYKNSRIIYDYIYHKYYLLIPKIMKKIILFSTMFAITISTFGQIARCSDLSKPDELQKEITSINNTRNIGDTIYYEDFGNGIPVGWVSIDNTGNNFDWIYSTVGPTGAWTGSWPNPVTAINSPSSSNGFMMYPMDFYNTDFSGQMVTNPIDFDSYLQTSAFDCSGEQSVILTFASEFRTCCASTAKLWITVSTDGVSWSNQYIVNEDIPNNEWWYLEPQFNISDIAAGYSTVYIRFGVSDVSHYFWEIDDILLCRGAANDIRIKDNYVDFFSSFSGYYNQIPLKQASNYSIYFGSTIYNNGTNVANNCVMNTTVEHNSLGQVFNKTSVSKDIVQNAVDTFKFINYMDGFRADTIGDYNVTYLVSSDSIDEIPDDNMITCNFSVSDHVYARDNGDVQNADKVSSQIWAGGQTDGYLFGVTYKINTPCEVHKMSIFVHNDSEEGTVIIGKLLESDGNGGYMPLLFTLEYYISWSDTSTWITLYFELDGQSEFLDPGKYLVAIEQYFMGYDFYIGEDTETKQDPWATIWNDPMNPGFYYYSNYSNTPMIRLITENTVILYSDFASDLRFGENSLQVQFFDISQGNITSWSWDFGDGTNSNVQNPIHTFQSIGSYSVSLNVSDGTSNNNSIKTNYIIVYEPLVSSIISTSVNNGFDISCYGMSDGSVDLSLVGGMPPFSFLWSNGETTEDVNNLAAGTYSVTISMINAYSIVDTISLIQPSEISLNFEITNASNMSSTDGDINLTVNGGLSPYSFNWSNGENSEDISNLLYGTYSVTVTDGLNCSMDSSISVDYSNIITKLPQNNQFILFQNTPNPFSNTTEIGFYIPEKAFVEIELFNLIGEKIENIQAKNYEKGKHSIIYNKKNLSSGVYFYRLSSKDFSATKIMNILNDY